MADLTQEFDRQWDEFVQKEAALVKEKHLLPVAYTDVNGNKKELSLEDFQSTLDNLRNEKFTIAVCGAVKAGKSTFLNSLLFGKEVLPAFSTPITAKLNFIEYTEGENYFEVRFYSRDEWQRLLDNLDADNKKQLAERIQKCGEDFGVHDVSCIDQPSQTINDLNALEEYVSDPLAGKGKYTPFVKDVAIRINTPQIKQLRIVDTPGLNDPNTINSEETVKWIKEAHAVIFLLRPKGYEASDKDFVDKNLLTTQPSTRLWIINKIDDLNGIAEVNSVKDYMRYLGQTDDFRKKNLFGDDEKICAYSALISMLNRMVENGEELNEDQEEKLEIIDEDFDPDPDNVPQAVSSRLYENNGINRVSAGVARVKDVYKKNCEFLQAEYDDCKRTLKNLESDDEKLKQEIQSITKTAKKLKTLLETFQSEYRNKSLLIIKEELAARIQQKIESFENRIVREIRAANTTAEMQICVQSLNRNLRTLFGYTGDLNAYSDACRKRLNIPLGEIAKKVRREFEEAGITDDDIDFSPIENIVNKFPDTSEIGVVLDRELNQRLPSNFLSDLLTSKSSKRSSCIQALCSAISQIHVKLEQYTEDFHMSVLASVESGFRSFQDAVTSSSLAKESEIGIDPQQQAIKKAETETKKAEVETRLSDIKTLQQQYINNLPAKLRGK